MPVDRSNIPDGTWSEDSYESHYGESEDEPIDKELKAEIIESLRPFVSRFNTLKWLDPFPTKPVHEFGIALSDNLRTAAKPIGEIVRSKFIVTEMKSKPKKVDSDSWSDPSSLSSNEADRIKPLKAKLLGELLPQGDEPASKTEKRGLRPTPAAQGSPALPDGFKEELAEAVKRKYGERASNRQQTTTETAQDPNAPPPLSPGPPPPPPPRPEDLLGNRPVPLPKNWTPPPEILETLSAEEKSELFAKLGISKKGPEEPAGSSSSEYQSSVSQITSSEESAEDKPKPPQHTPVPEKMKPDGISPKGQAFIDEASGVMLNQEKWNNAMETVVGTINDQVHVLTFENIPKLQKGLKDVMTAASKDPEVKASEIKRLDEELANLNAKLEKTAVNPHIDHEIKKMKSRIKELGTEMKRVEETGAKAATGATDVLLRSQFDELSGEVERLNTVVEKLPDWDRRSNEKIAQIEQVITSLQRHRDPTELPRLMEESKRLENALHTYEIKIAQTEGALKAGEGAIERLRSEMTATGVQGKSMEATLKGVHENQEKLASHVKDLRKQQTFLAAGLGATAVAGLGFMAWKTISDLIANINKRKTAAKAGGSEKLAKRLHARDYLVYGPQVDPIF